MQNPSGLPPHMRKLLPPLSGPARPSPSGRLLASKHFALRRKSERDFTPSHWSEYFTAQQDITINDGNVFRVYLHEQSELIDNMPVLILLHGGGFSALTWSLFVKSLVELCNVRVMAIDIRGHGSSHTSNDEDLSVATMVNDITQVLLKMFNQSMPELILMGHSMGGALAAHFVDKCSEPSIDSRILGLIVIDVVEGTAKQALSQMQQVLQSRPSGFRSIENAIEWCVRSNQTRNIEAAKISMPGQIKQSQTGICAADLVLDTRSETHDESHHTDMPINSFGLSTLSEDSPISENKPVVATSDDLKSSDKQFIWRINLAHTEPFWMEWFDNLSQIFLNSKGGAKLLLLAGVDRLDGPMTVGQMQGKFQMQILPRVGHVIQEDDPDSVAQVVATYLCRNRFSTSRIDFERPFPSC
ncbi:protein phosphatase methylesterase 1 [Dermatophagoides pteronyssinus]|uniref:Protein phosphatase methylesterase 1 n=2 Tax=Dermatophagoides pteronyssinus TaxID=6956 RepID=A0ABQ8J177_DERPT|nr:probable protein phosphatase methylesterase 1 [Dermatophagoides pteronyssinus]KAH9416311.1 Protein phosphatase methylesterase 1 [Dermatophagoides pteronyssinus]